MSWIDTLFNTSHTIDVPTIIILGLLAVVMTLLQGYYQSRTPQDRKKNQFPKSGNSSKNQSRNNKKTK